MVRKKLIWLKRKKYLLLIPKPKQMMNINVKVKVINVTFSKKLKKQLFSHILKQNFAMFP